MKRLCERAPQTLALGTVILVSFLTSIVVTGLSEGGQGGGRQRANAAGRTLPDAQERGSLGLVFIRAGAAAGKRISAGKMGGRAPP
jgi:hypothetical protein